MKSLILPIILALSFAVVAQTPAAVERDILAQLKDVDKFGSYGGDSDEEKLDAANSAVRDLLIKNAARLDVLRYSFPALKKEINIVTSRDGKLRIYSWDMQTGGTMHDYDTVFQYQGASGKTYSWTAPDSSEDSGGGFFSQIFQVDSASGPIYIANSTFVAETSLHGQSIETMRILRDKLERSAKLIKTASGLKSSIDFSYDPFSSPKGTDELVFFDPVRKSFRFPVIIEDKKDDRGRITNRFITYRFNGQYFVKVP